jgi:ubiquinone biosynthesis UbiH/UbiF/VisC/COQ6 family hydroxylase
MIMPYEVSIVGAGLVGATMALMLANQDVAVRLIDAQAALIPSDTPDLRVVALNGQSIAWLKACGVWSRLNPNRLGIFESLGVEDQGQSLCFNAADQGLSKLGVIAENNHIIAAAQAACLNHPNIHTHFSTKFEYDPNDPPLVIAAEGAQSSLRQALNIPSFSHDYQQTAWVATVTLEHPHNNQAWQIFLPTGPLAFLPLHHPHKASVVWTRPKDSAEFTSDEITQASQNHYGFIALDSPLAKFPLKIQVAQHYYKKNVVFIGDAIHSIHPLAGQGVNLGFADAQTLSALLLSHKPASWTNPLLLKKYQRERKLPNTLMAHGMTCINSLFAQENPWLIKARIAALKTFSQSSSLKNAALSVATGLSDSQSL